MNEGERSAQTVEEDLKLLGVARRALARHSEHGGTVGLHELEVNVEMFTHEGDVLLQHAKEFGDFHMYQVCRSINTAESTKPSTLRTKERVRSRLAAVPAAVLASATREEWTGVRRPALAEDVGQGEEALISVHGSSCR